MVKFAALVTRCRMLRGGLAAAVTSAVTTASAQAYPSKPITLVVGLAPGSGQDTSARTVARRASELLGVQLVVEKLNAIFNAILRDPLVREELKGLGFVPRTMTPEEFVTFLHDEMARWPAIVAAAGISAE